MARVQSIAVENVKSGIGPLRFLHGAHRVPTPTLLISLMVSPINPHTADKFDGLSHFRMRWPHNTFKEMSNM